MARFSVAAGRIPAAMRLPHGFGNGMPGGMESPADRPQDGAASAGRLAALAAGNAILVLTIGTFATHGLKDAQARDWVMTGVLFQLPHVAAVFAILAWQPGPMARAGAWALAIGSLIFAGTLYALALGAPRAVAIVAPVGGTMMMLGWAWIALLALAGERLAQLLKQR